MIGGCRTGAAVVRPGKSDDGRERGRRRACRGCARVGRSGGCERRFHHAQARRATITISSDLCHQAEEGRRSWPRPARKPPPKQHAEQAGAEEAGGQTAEHAAHAAEHASRLLHGRTRRGRACGARRTRLRHRAINRCSRIRCGRGRRRGRIGLRTARANAAALPCIGIAGQHREHRCDSNQSK